MSSTAHSIVMVALAAGCANPYTVDDYWSDLATTHCRRMENCCTPAEYADWWTNSLGTQDCQSVWQSRPDAVSIHAALEHGKLAFDPVAAHACLDALAAQTCGEFEPAYRYRETYCEPPLRGLVAVGAACDQDLECESTSCAIDPTTRRGTCTATVASGQACTGNTGAPACERPDACQPDRTCGPGQPAGAACQYDYECADDWCKGGGVFTQGACVRACNGL